MILLPSQMVKDYFERAHQYAAVDIQEANYHVGQVGSQAIGNLVKIYLELTAAQTIKKAYLQAYGCPFTLAAGALLVESMIGQSVSMFKSYNSDWIIETLDIPEQKHHGAIRAHEAMRLALQAKDLCA